MSGKYKILLIDNLMVRKMDLEVGETIIGNDIETNLDKKPQYRQAAKINLSSDSEISITPCEKVLCYVKIYGTVRWKLVSSESAVILNVKDTCLLFPNKIWFKVIYAMDNTDETKSPKRKLEKLLEDEKSGKRLCSQINIEIEPSNSVVPNNGNESKLIVTNYANNLNVGNDDDASDSVQCSNFDTLETKQEIKLCSSEKSNEQINSILNSDDNEAIQITNSSNLNRDSNVNLESRQQNVESGAVNINIDTNNSNETSTSNIQNIPKQKCKYGSECYRLNEEHMRKYSHPGDSDYDLPDNRPECYYGRKCYRKNLQHKLEYKHTISKRKKNPTCSEPVSLEDLSDFEESPDESVDESEYEPSFIDDDSWEDFESDFDEDK